MRVEIEEEDLVQYLGNLNALDTPLYSLSQREKLAIDEPNVKFGKGLYKVNNEMYMSIWAYKNEYGVGHNSNQSNYSDAIRMSKSGLTKDLVIVHTDSPYYPTVRGYLRKNLNKFY